MKFGQDMLYLVTLLGTNFEYFYTMFAEIRNASMITAHHSLSFVLVCFSLLSLNRAAQFLFLRLVLLSFECAIQHTVSFLSGPFKQTPKS